MGFLDGVIGAYFKNDPQGRTVFFPWGSPGKGYIAPNVRVAEALRRTLKIFFIVLLGVFFAAQFLLGPLALVIAGLAASLWYYVAIVGTARQWPESDMRMSFSQSIDQQAASTGKGSLKILFFGSLALFALSLLGLTRAETQGVASAGIVISLTAAAVFGYMLKRQS